jgi:serine/threonine protein phosphatase PrpC
VNFELFEASRKGARSDNQDRIGVARTPESLLLVVADGMGGHAHGELAAQIVVEYLAKEFQREAQPRLANPDLFLFRAAGRAHAEILRQTQLFGLPESPRTVAVACVVQAGEAHWVHVGDARLYLIRGARIVTRTRDHTRVQELVDAGRIREEAVAAHPERNIVLQCLGGIAPPRVEPSARARLERNDVVLLCSDGFWSPLTQRQLVHALLTQPLERAMSELMSLAEARAGAQCDNLSAVAIVWREEARDETEPPQLSVPSLEQPAEVQDLSATDPDYLHMSDEDIERAIAELKAALRKNPPRP